MPSLAMPLILVFLACFSLQTLADCPNQWLKYGESCYNFIMNSPKTIDMAKEECSKYGATLVNVNSGGENNFLTSYFVSSLTPPPNLARSPASAHAAALAPTSPTPPSSGTYHCPYHITDSFTYSSSNVIYCISCSFCSVYISQTRRCLADWFAEHLRDIRFSNDTPVSHHFHPTGHSLQHLFTWYTSGEYLGNNKFRWIGDGQDINNKEMFWVNDAVKNSTGRFITYIYHDGKYSWIRDDGQTLRSSICEIPEKESYRIYNQHRNFDYGQHLKDMNNIQRGPKTKREPENVLAIMYPPRTYMEFTAFGNPPPVYSWYRESTVLSSSLDSRYTLTNGRLTISPPKRGVDDTYYHCLASNNYGKIMSQTVQFTFGFLGEFLNTQREGVVANSYDGTYLQCKPPNHNPALRYQWAFNDSINFVRPDKNSYLFISHNGNLYFSEVTQTDAGSYFCIVALASPDDYKDFSNTQSMLRTSMAIQLKIKNKGK
uniref:Ig-like domain-containing protein n=1 Tax=Octopus bimaculoides TaxID=37653 RepID=A0A0L8GSX5_OCTBM